MPFTEGLYRCKICSGQFRATSEGFSSCQCGESSIRPERNSYTYENGNRVIELNSNTYYSKEEFIPLTDKAKKALDSLREINIKNRNYPHISEFYEDGQQGEKYLRDIYVSYFGTLGSPGTRNEIRMNIDLFKKYTSANEEDVENRLIKMLNLAKMIEDKKLDISNRKKLIEYSEEQRLEYDWEQVEEYDYTFYV